MKKQKSQPTKTIQSLEGPSQLIRLSSRPSTASKTKTAEQLNVINSNIERIVECTSEQQHQLNVVTASLSKLENMVVSLSQRIEQFDSAGCSHRFDPQREGYQPQEDPRSHNMRSGAFKIPTVYSSAEQPNDQGWDRRQELGQNRPKPRMKQPSQPSRNQPSFAHNDNIYQPNRGFTDNINRQNELRIAELLRMTDELSMRINSFEEQLFRISKKIAEVERDIKDQEERYAGERADLTKLEELDQKIEQLRQIQGEITRQKRKIYAQRARVEEEISKLKSMKSRPLRQSQQPIILRKPIYHNKLERNTEKYEDLMLEPKGRMQQPFLSKAEQIPSYYNEGGSQTQQPKDQYAYIQQTIVTRNMAPSTNEGRYNAKMVQPRMRLQAQCPEPGMILKATAVAEPKKRIAKPSAKDNYNPGETEVGKKNVVVEPIKGRDNPRGSSESDSSSYESAKSKGSRRSSHSNRKDLTAVPPNQPDPLPIGRIESMPETSVKPQALLIKMPSLPEEGQNEQPKQTVKQGDSHSSAFPSRLALVQFDQKEIIIPIEPFLQKAAKEELTLDSAKLAISRWIAEVYDKLGRESFSGYLSKHLSESDAKVYFTHNLSLNFENMVEHLWHNCTDLWKTSRSALIGHFEEQSMRTLDFMMVKYPQKKKTFISEEIRNAIPSMDESEDPTYDFIHSSKGYFQYDESRRSYSTRVKMMLNALMSESQKYLPAFKSIVEELFTVGPDRHRLKNLIGMKFKENSPQYSKRELEEPGVQIKNPEVLRVIIKWTEELEKKVRNLGNGSIIHNSFAVREGGSEHLNKFMKEDLRKLMREKTELLDQASEEMRLRIRSVLSLFPEFVDKYLDEFAHIKPSQVRSGLLSYVLSESASNLSVNYLLFIIHFLEEAVVKTKRFDGKGNIHTVDKAGQQFVDTVEYRNFSFVTFKISDLLRCKCTGSLTEIKEVWEKLKDHPQLKVYRVKNRLDTSNKDFLVNALLVGTSLLCEIQLAVAGSSGDQKADCMNHFSHFMYELSRASYGPIAEAVIINSYLTEFAGFFRDQLGRIPTKYVPLKDCRVECVKGKISVECHVPRDNNFSFLCANCLELRVANTHSLQNFDSATSILAKDAVVQHSDELRDVICGDCAYRSLKLQDQAIWVLGTQLSDFFIAKAPEEAVNDKVLCIVQKSGAVRKMHMVQRVELKEVYVPVFYECSSEKFQLSAKELKANYYLFKLHSRLKPTLMRAKDLELLSKGSFNGKEVIFSAEYARKGTAAISAEHIEIVASDTSARLLVLNSYHKPEEMANLIHRNKKFKEVEISVMMKSPIWRLERSNIGDDSFQIPAFDAQLSHLKELAASENNITLVCVVSSQTLQKLDLSTNAVKELKLQPSDYPSMVELELTTNPIERIVMVKHDKLRKLYLGNNAIAECNEQQWNLPELVHLQLCSNKLTTLNLEKMQCPKLRQLDACNIKCNVGSNPHLERIVFGNNTPLLESISLLGCALLEMEMRLYPFDHLKKLNLCSQLWYSAKNKIEAMIFPSVLDQLQEINLSDNRLQFIDIASCSLPRLKKLDIERNRLTELLLPQELTKLQQLMVGENKLRELVLEQIKMDKLRILHGEKNPFEALILPQNTKHLETIKLSEFKFPCFDLRGRKLPKLMQLHLASPSLSQLDIPSDFPNLQELHLKDNRLTSLNLGNLNLPSLRVLEIANMSLREFVLPLSLPRLESLVVTQVKMQGINLVGRELPELRVLDLHNNRLSEFELVDPLPKLQLLNLSYGGLYKLKLKTESLPSLTFLNISINHFDSLIFQSEASLPELETIDYRYSTSKISQISNVQLTDSAKFPKLKTVLVGIDSIGATVLWSLQRMGWGRRYQLYDQLRKTTCATFDQDSVEVLALKSGSPIEATEKLSQEINKQLALLLELLLSTREVAGYAEEARDLLSQSKK